MKKEDIHICLDLLIQHGHVDVARRVALEFKDDEYCQKVWSVIKPPRYKGQRGVIWKQVKGW